MSQSLQHEAAERERERPTEPTGETDAERGRPDAACDSADTEAVLSLLSDDHARAILDALADGPSAARQLVERLDASRATVYRRLDALESAGLVDSTLSIRADGHHRRRFRAAAGRVSVRFGSDGVSVAVGEPARDDPLHY
jgi:DNA-binding transcriptional ArsR family regulator